MRTLQHKPMVAAVLLGLLLGGCANADLGALVAADPKLLDASRDHAAPAATTARQKAVTVVANAQPTSTASQPTAPQATAPTGQTSGQIAGQTSSNDQQIMAALKVLERGDAPAAERLLKAVPAEAPDWRVHSGLGIAASALGRQTDAQAQFKKALQLSPRNPAVLNNLAVSYMLDRNPTEAEVVLKRATANGSASRETLDNLALARTLKAQMDGRSTP
jgi:Flp pilus assembly protein TadD